MSTRREAAIEAILAQQEEKRAELEKLRIALEETEQDMVELDTAMAGLESNGIGGDVNITVPVPEVNVTVPTPEVNVNVPVPEVNVSAPQVTINPNFNITGLVDLINRITALENSNFADPVDPPPAPSFTCDDVANCQVIQNLQNDVSNLQSDVAILQGQIYNVDQRMLYNEDRLDKVIIQENVPVPGLLVKPDYTPIEAP